MKYLKNFSKRLKKMGQGGSSHHPGSSKGGPFSSRRKQSGATPPTNYDLPPLRFHLTHGENITLTPSKEEAIRADSFCKGIVFSNRPVMVNERVCIRIAELNNRWNGVLRIGFSSHDPASLPRPLPKYACPDLTSKPGYWAKALSERYVGLNKLIHYHVSGNGDVHFGIDGEDLGVFFSGVDTRTPLWALVDLYGNCTSIELVDTRQHTNNHSSNNGGDHQNTNGLVRSHSTGNSANISAIEVQNNASRHFEHSRTLPRNSSGANIPNQPSSILTADPPPPNYPNSHNVSPSRQQPTVIPPSFSNIPQMRPQIQELDTDFRRLSTETNNHNPPISQLPEPIQQPSQLHQTNQSSSNGNFDSTNRDELRFNQGIQFRPMQFHLGCGQNAQIVDSGNNTEDDRKVAFRRAEEFAQGYVFSQDIIKPGERIVVKVVETEYSYIGSLAFGLTNCDPSSINLRDLPEDSDLLLDRSEYWVVSKDVANNPDIGDELSFKINVDGSVEFSKNGNIPSAFMHVDVTLPLWAFWDIYGNTSKIRLIGSTQNPVLRPFKFHAPLNASALPPQQQCSDQEQCSSTRNNHIVAELNCSAQSGLPSNISNMSENGPGKVPTNTNLDSSMTKTDNMLNTSFGSNSGGGPSECTLCFENPIDCVLYTCGHMCMCYDCALHQWKRGGGFCPLCRNDIRDVIRTFRS